MFVPTAESIISPIDGAFFQPFEILSIAVTFAVVAGAVGVSILSRLLPRESERPDLTRSILKTYDFFLLLSSSTSSFSPPITSFTARSSSDWPFTAMIRSPTLKLRRAAGEGWGGGGRAGGRAARARATARARRARGRILRARAPALLVGRVPRLDGDDDVVLDLEAAVAILVGLDLDRLAARLLPHHAGRRGRRRRRGLREQPH